MATAIAAATRRLGGGDEPDWDRGLRITDPASMRRTDNSWNPCPFRGLDHHAPVVIDITGRHLTAGVTLSTMDANRHSVR
jgi:hypothetical protein